MRNEINTQQSNKIEEQLELNLVNNNQIELNTLKSKYENELNTLKSKYEDEICTLKSEHNNEISILQSNIDYYENELSTLKSELTKFNLEPILPQVAAEKVTTKSLPKKIGKVIIGKSEKNASQLKSEPLETNKQVFKRLPEIDNIIMQMKKDEISYKKIAIHLVSLGYKNPTVNGEVNFNEKSVIRRYNALIKLEEMQSYYQNTKQYSQFAR